MGRERVSRQFYGPTRRPRTTSDDDTLAGATTSATEATRARTQKMNALTATTLALGLVVGSACAAPVEKTIEIVGPPIKLRYGEVHNAWQPPIDFPDEVKQKFAGKTMPVVDWTVDIVYKNGSQVPLYDTHNHHYIPSAGTRAAMQRFHDMMQDAPYGL